MPTLSEENYLKAIFHLGYGHSDGVSTNAIAYKMDTKASSATDMVKKLAEKQLVNYKKYQGAKLTEQGRQAAVAVIRKHRLWETFLVEKLNFSWDEVHQVAEQLEHVESEKLIDELDAYLDFPKFDPHGHPIPDKNGHIHKTEKLKLSQAPIPNTYICVGVNDSSAEFLQYLDKIGIALGTPIKVLSKEVFDESLTISIGGGQLHISKLVASNLYVNFNH